MSTPDDQNVERGQVVPPWKRGEKTASTGLTAGEMAKAAGVDTGSRPAAGPAPRGVVSGTSSSTARPAASSQGSASSGSGSSSPNPSGASPSTPASGGAGSPSAVGGASSGPAGPTGPAQGPKQAPQAPQSAPESSQPQGPKPAQPQGPKPAQPQGPNSAQPQGPKPPQPQAQSNPTVKAPAEQKAFVESDTRNIPRNELAKKDELPDLDAIHHVEASKEAKAAARAQSQTIPSRSIGVPLRAAVQIRRVDPWSVFKVTGVLAIVGFFIWMIAIAILYGVLGGMGVWDQINSSFGNLVEGEGQSTGDLIGTGMVFGFSAAFGVIAAILVTGLATISAYIYNVCADMVGGVEVTLSDLD
ncbi:DUF3566 domain-containing protein [Gordonia sp. MP11Mi]|uniref:DUF3566 domain-containing protein n=1 Tax=Gordonia sp. MP11Mi TaxID=3022769 RepID=A0AA97CW06_9ACTN